MRIPKWLAPLLILLIIGLYFISTRQNQLISYFVVSGMLDDMDANADGVLTAGEGFEGMFSLVDSNRDGQADREELSALVVRSLQPFRWSNPPAEQQMHVAHETFFSEMLK